MSQNQLAFVFPGQGSQKVGMLANAAASYSEVADTFSQASEVLGYDLWDLVQAGPQEALNLTEKTQPLLLTASVALWRVWLANGGAKPSLMAGHSLGEFSALVCSEVIGFEAAVDLVRQRGAFMQSAVPVGIGAMAAIIGLDDESIRDSRRCDARSSLANSSMVNPRVFNGFLILWAKPRAISPNSR